MKKLLKFLGIVIVLAAVGGGSYVGGYYEGKHDAGIIQGAKNDANNISDYLQNNTNNISTAINTDANNVAVAVKKEAHKVSQSVKSENTTTDNPKPDNAVKRTVKKVKSWFHKKD